MDNDGFGGGHRRDQYSFHYVYTCDIEDSVFRVKVGNLDGIIPPLSNKESIPKSSPSGQSKFTNVQNHYDYNVVEDLDKLSFLDELMLSSDEDESHDDETSGIESDDNRSRPSFLHPFDRSKGKETKNKHRKKKKLAEMIFGNLNQPFRALSAHPYITCDLISNGQRLCPPQQSQYRQMSTRYEWNEWLVFSLTLDILPRDTLVCFTVWDTIGPGKMAAVARTAISLFSKRGCMRRGLYDLRLYFNEDCEEYYRQSSKSSSSILHAAHGDLGLNHEITMADVNLANRKHRIEEHVLPEKEMVAQLKRHLNLVPEKDSEVEAVYRARSVNKDFDVTSIEFTSMTQYLESDLSNYPNGNCGCSKKIRQLTKLKKKYYNDQMPKLDWLDQLTFLQIERAMMQDKSMSNFVFLTVEFPTIVLDGVEHYAVYFEDKDEQCCQYDIIEKDIVTIQDPEINLPNLVEQKHHALARSARSGIMHDQKPNATIRNQLNTIVNWPSTRQLTSEEQDLIWKYRFYLKNQKKALAKFLKTVNWSSPPEVEQAITLMNEWAPMDVEDALELLSPHFTHPAVRRYAVSRLKEALDEDLLLYLLQLVQALKYENFSEIQLAYEAELLEYEKHQDSCSTPPVSKDIKIDKRFSENPHPTAEAFLAESMKIFSSPPPPSGESIEHSKRPETSTSVSSPNTNTATRMVNQYGEDLATFLLNRACANDELANYFFWYMAVECEGAKSLASSTASSSAGERAGSTGTLTPSYPSVISSAVTNSYLTSPPAPFTTVESDSKSKNFPELTSLSTSVSTVVEMYLIVMKRFSTRLLRGTPEMGARRKFLLRQQDFVIKLVEIMKDIQRESGSRLKKIEKLQNILASPEPHLRFSFSKNDPLPLPLNPSIKVVGVLSNEATLFKSAMMPAKLTFLTTEGLTYYTIFKHGDDLRQDDLVLQMISLMDKLLRKENLDLKLTPYRVLACSAKHGFVEFIDSQSVADVLSSNDNSIQNYLIKISNSAPTITYSSTNDFQLVSTGQTKTKGSSVSLSSQLPAGSSSSISPEVMDAYIKSCAGYSVITYLLGVGDRHLDNLMLTRMGRLFHIDFGFILGRDPKVRPPPMKITREMVDAMGGMGSDNFSKFCTLVRTAFLHLRRHANLILNLFSLMVDANVPDIALEPDKTVQKVQDKFKLELNDEQADHYITELVEQSVRSFMPVMVDHLHRMTQYLRN